VGTRFSWMGAATLTVSVVTATFVAQQVAFASPVPVTPAASFTSAVGAPKGVTARPLHGAARVSWHSPTVPAGRTLVSYVVRATGGTSVTAAASAHAVTVTGLADGWWRSFTVAAVYDDASQAISSRSARVAMPVISGWSTKVTGGASGAVISEAVSVRPAAVWTLQLQRRRAAVAHWTQDVSTTSASSGAGVVKLHLVGGSWQWRLSVTPADPATDVSAVVASAVRPVIASAHACVWAPTKILTAPKNSGTGKRIIWDKSANQVWLVEKTGTVRCSYLVTDNDEDTPVGTYQVRSKSVWSSSVDEGRYWRLAHMVRFYLQPGHRLWIGFHAVPVSPSGQLIQPLSSLGKAGYRSHGCVRQHPTNAANLFAFARIGTKVVVIA
jgi:lipoprotein-anchoring transpeptidase ErfK/SrfK